MKILLVNPPIREWAKPNIVPLGLAYIGAILKEHGHDVEVLDINAHRFSWQEVTERLREASYDIVGIGGIVTVYSYIKELIALCKTVKPDAMVVAGGSVSTSIPHVMFERTLVDVVCVGEGEVTMLELVTAVEKKRDLASVDGIWYRDDKGDVTRNRAREMLMDLDNLPLPAWDLFPMDIYLSNPVGAPNRNKWADGSITDGEEKLSMNVSATRGCPYQCTYCYHDYMGQKYRSRSPEHVVKEIAALRDRYNVTYIHFVDDEFCLSKTFVLDFCRLMKDTFGGDVTWGCTGRVNLMTEGLVQAMVDAGCVLIGYGIESGSQKMLDLMKKNVTVAEARYAVELTKKYLGWADCSFIIGLPGETKETVAETVCFCKELDLAPEVIFFATPYPGTELYDMAMQQGKIGDEEQYCLGLGEQGERIRVNFTEFSDEELYQMQEDMIRELGAWNKVKHPESR